jgi:peptidoglycan/xylan/chitin deacetylase (PgdA/CDA1 family)
MIVPFLLLTALAFPTAVSSTLNVPVLTYHRIDILTPAQQGDKHLEAVTVSPGLFEEHLRYFISKGYTFLTAVEVADAVIHQKPLPIRSVCITLDDGYDNNYVQALPILKKLGLRATVFMVVDNIGKPNRLSWSNIYEMERTGIVFESHGVTHANFVKMNPFQLKSELLLSRVCLRLGLWTPISSIAYPRGMFSDTVSQAIADCGYSSAWVVRGGNVHSGSNPLRLPRIPVHGGTTVQELSQMIDPFRQ